MRAQIKARGAVYALLSACIPGSGVSFLTYYHTLMKRDGIESESLHPPLRKVSFWFPGMETNRQKTGGWDPICHPPGKGAAFDCPGR
jgi:hypothetical protein